jgi:hypothetical protein
VKAALRGADRSQLVLVVSDLLYKQVVRHGYRSVNPATYGKVDVQRIGEPAWVRAPGYPAAPIEAQQPGPAASHAVPGVTGKLDAVWQEAGKSIYNGDIWVEGGDFNG